MTNELISIFDNAGDIDQIVKDAYVLKVGMYLEIDESGDILNHLFVDKKSERTTDLYKKFIEYDYLSNYVSSNKALGIKTMHSNSYLSLFFKYELLKNKKTALQHIDKYYERVISLDGCPKEADKTRSFYEKEGLSFLEKIDEMVKAYRETNKVSDKKFYIRIFRKADLTIYEEEALRYYKENIFVNPSTVVELDGVKVGAPSFDTTYNNDKPFFNHMTTPFNISKRTTLEEAIKLYKIRLWLQFKSNISEEIYIPFDYDFKSEPTFLDNKPCLYFKVVFGSAELCILDMKVIQQKETNEHFILNNCLNIENPSPKILTIKEVRHLMSKIFFENALSQSNSSLIKEKAEIDRRLELLIYSNQDALLEWFNGNDLFIKPVIDKMTQRACEHILKKTYQKSIIIYKEAFNLRLCLLDHFKKNEEETFMNQFKEIHQTIETGIKDRMEGNEMFYIEDDKTYYYAAGQLIYYILSKKEKKEKTLTELIPFTLAKKQAYFNQLLNRITNAYAHKLKGRKFESLYGAIANYKPTESPSKMNDYLMAGYLSKNILYTKQENEEVENDEQENE